MVAQSRLIRSPASSPKSGLSCRASLCSSEIGPCPLSGVKRTFQGKNRHLPDRGRVPSAGSENVADESGGHYRSPLSRGLATRSLGSTPDHKGPMLILI